MKKHILILLLFSLLCIVQPLLFLEASPPAAGAGEEITVPGARVSFYKEENIMDARPYLKKKADGSDQVLAVMLVQYQGIKILDLTNAASPTPLGTYIHPSGARLGSFTIAPDYPVDLNNDGLYGEREKKDLVFFSVLAEQLIVVVDITTPTAPVLFREIKVNDSGGMMDMAVVPGEHTLYVSDMDKGLILVDMTFTGKDQLHDNEGKRIVSCIGTTGSPRRGLTVNTDLNIAYVGQLKGGVDILKLGNPKMKLVYKDTSGVYKEVSRIAPFGVKNENNLSDFPNTIYAMTWLPGGGGSNVTADIWSLNGVDNPIMPAGSSKTFLKSLPLKQKSENRLSSDYNVYISDPIQVTLLPNDSRTGLTLLSGRYIKAHLSETVAKTLVYLTEKDCRNIMDRKLSVQADLVDRGDNFAEGKDDKPNSPAANPSIAKGVLLHSGELVSGTVDQHIPGRGFDFAFARTYRSQAIYSGPLGWGWDHQYNKRLVEYPDGDMIYYDGSGRREHYQFNNGSFDTPDGRMDTLKRKTDGSFRLVATNGVIEIFDALGRLKSIRDTNKNKMEFLYNPVGQLSGIIDTMGRIIELEYFPFQLDAAETAYTPLSGRLKSVRDFDARTIDFQYSPVGDLQWVQYGEGRSLYYLYSANPKMEMAHNLTSVDRSGTTGLTVLYEEDTDVVRSLTFGENGQYGFVTGPQATVTDPANNVTTYTHDADGHVTHFNDSLYTTQFSYDKGLLKDVTYPEGNIVSYAYLSGTSLVTAITENPNNKERHPDEAGQFVTSFTYDPIGKNIVSMRYADGLTDNYTYNKYGQLESQYMAFVDSEDNIVHKGKTTAYQYYPESLPGGAGSDVNSPRFRDSGTGGYLKRQTLFYGDSIPAFGPGGGLWKEFKYKSRGSLTESTGSDGVSATYTVNDFDEVTRESIFARAANSLSGSLSFHGDYSYTQRGNLKDQTLSAGSLSRRTDYTYDNRDNLRLQSDSARGTTSYTYDSRNNVTQVAGPAGTVSMTYNSRNMVESISDGVNNYTFGYDGNGNTLTVTDTFGKVTHFKYDGYDRLAEVNDPLGNRAVYSHFNYGNSSVAKRYDSGAELLHQSTVNNDPLGRMKSYAVKLPNDVESTYNFTYEDDGKTVVITDAANNQSKIMRNEFGRVIQEVDALGNVTDYLYEDGRGNVTRKTETVKSSDGLLTETYTTTYTYSSHNKVETITDSMGHVTRFSYDAAGNLIETTDAEGHRVTHAYDGHGRKVKTIRYMDVEGKEVPVETVFEYYAKNTYKIDPETNATSGTFSPAGKLKSITDAKGNRTVYQYDSHSRPIRITYPDGTFIKYDYEQLVGNPHEGKYYSMVSETQRNGTVVKTYYDVKNRLGKREVLGTDVDGTTWETYEYDGLSRVTKATDNDSTIEMGYDLGGRMVNEKTLGKLLEYTYDNLNNLKTIKYPGGRQLNQDFDSLRRLNKIVDNGSNVTVAEMLHIGRSYRLVSMQYGSGDLISYHYDQARRMTSKKTTKLNEDGAMLTQFDYGYNKVGMKLYEVRGHQGNKGDAYKYDKLQRLTGIKFDADGITPQNTDPATYAKSWASAYDKVDNALSIVQTDAEKTKTITPQIPKNSDYEKLHQYATFDGVNISYDLNGNTKHKGGLKFYFDYRDQLVRVVEGTVTTNYTYDALGRRLEKNVDGQITRYIYSGHHVVEERDASDNLLKEYFYGSGIDNLLSFNVHKDGAVTSYYIHRNGIGSIVALTDANGDLIERVTYDAYGNASFIDANGDPMASSGVGNEILFQGRRYDAETNLYYFRARYYDPVMGRFLQNDPMGYHDSMNMYQAFNMNGVNFVDPMGLVSEGGFGFRTKDEINNSFAKRGDAPEDGDKTVMTVFSFTDGGDALTGAELASGTNLETGKPLTPAEKVITGVALVAGVAIPLLSTRPMLKLGRKIFKGISKLFKGTKKPIAEATEIVVEQVIKKGDDIVDAAADAGKSAKAGVKATSTSGMALTLEEIPGFVAKHKDKTLIIGNLPDTAVAKNWGGHWIIDIDNWTPELQKAFIDEVIKKRVKIYLGSPQNADNLFDSLFNRPRIFSEELEQLAPFYDQVGDYLIPNEVATKLFKEL